MPPGVAAHIVYDENGVVHTIYPDESGGLPVYDEDGNLHSLTLTEA